MPSGRNGMHLVHLRSHQNGGSTASEYDLIAAFISADCGSWRLAEIPGNVFGPIEVYVGIAIG